MALISELLTLPESVHRGDFVPRLAEGMSDAQADATLKEYVVSPSLRDNFGDALRLIKGAIDSRSSKGAYLHGSFGSGKSHFMAVLYLLLKGSTAARGLEPVADLGWAAGPPFLTLSDQRLACSSHRIRLGSHQASRKCQVCWSWHPSWTWYLSGTSSTSSITPDVVPVGLPPRCSRGQ